ncbi:hypothetical protein K474DRAFT_1670528 [Panus rudis PR-1116 ss-1]|nr:hypothetical protein K474DRAFT_1670528 [Panus rudis PR-1116 ss-1]
MGKKNKSSTPPEDLLILPPHPSFSSLSSSSSSSSSTLSSMSTSQTPPPIIDTHTHLLSTYIAYKSRYKPGKHSSSIYDFIRAMYNDQGGHPGKSKVKAIVDVWCEAPLLKEWKELADSALSGSDGTWGGVEYWFVIGGFLIERLCDPDEWVCV